MGDLEFETDVRQIDSIVLGTVENIARGQGFSISPAAKDYLLNRVRKNLDYALQRGELEQRASEIERNTAEFMDRVVVDIQGQTPQATQIDINTVRSAFGWLCSRYPNFFPFCP